MADRLHALQGRASVECPKCGHPLSRHDGDRCAVCVSYVRAEGWSAANASARLGVSGSRMGAPYSLCATREDEAGRLVCPDGGGKCEDGCDRAEWCPGPVPFDAGVGR